MTLPLPKPKPRPGCEVCGKSTHTTREGWEKPYLCR